MSIMISFDVNYDDIYRSFFLCDVHFSVNYSGTDIPKIKQTF